MHVGIAWFVDGVGWVLGYANANPTYRAGKRVVESWGIDRW